jgi:hypothetical protein
LVQHVVIGRMDGRRRRGNAIIACGHGQSL